MSSELKHESLDSSSQRNSAISVYRRWSLLITISPLTLAVSKIGPFLQAVGLIGEEFGAVEGNFIQTKNIFFFIIIQSRCNFHLKTDLMSRGKENNQIIQ